jgi:hypothetical protein
MLAAAQQAGAHDLDLQARNWRALDLRELGRPGRASRGVEEFAALATRPRLPSYSWYVPMWRATLALMEGRTLVARAANEPPRRPTSIPEFAPPLAAALCR